MGLSRRANVLLLVFCLAVGVGGGAALAESFTQWQGLPSGDPRELIAVARFYLGLGGGLGSYFVCMTAVRRMTGRADRHGPEADYDDAAPPG